MCSPKKRVCINSIILYDLICIPNSLICHFKKLPFVWSVAIFLKSSLEVSTDAIQRWQSLLLSSPCQSITLYLFLNLKMMFLHVIFSILLCICRVFGENYVALESNKVTFQCKSSETPFWLERNKAISMAYGTKKRTNFNNDRSVSDWSMPLHLNGPSNSFLFYLNFKVSVGNLLDNCNLRCSSRLRSKIFI